MVMKKAWMIALAVFVTVSCKKEGPGGGNTIAAFPKHHGISINSGTMYIKYGAKESPGSDLSKYDAKAEVDVHPGEAAHAHFKELRKGDYYLFFAGFDSTINETVFGGIPIKLKKKSGETEIDVPVTE
jgi:hypothetical protein